MRNWIALAGLVFTAACGSSGTDIKCGDGTTLDNGECVSTGSGSGNTVTCGAGTQLDSTGTMCVPTPPAATGAPTITMITPNEAGASGGVLFEIDGTGFAGDDVTDLHVYFGDTTPSTMDMPNPCEAEIAMAGPTFVAGEVPAACDISVTVTLQTNLGMATTPFKYDAILLGDGPDFDFGQAGASSSGNVYVMDPFAGKTVAAGAPGDGNGNTFTYEGLAFASDATLYAVTDGNSAGDAAVDAVPELVTIDLTMGLVTPVGDLVDGDGNQWYIDDIKMSGTTLFGWGYLTTDGGNTFTQSLVSISTTDGTVTPIGTPAADTFGLGGLAIDGTGTVYVAANSASDSDFEGLTESGELDTADTTTGALSAVASLDYGISAPITSMTFVGTQLVAGVDEGFYDAEMTGFQVHGVVLALIDPTNESISPLYQLPGSFVDEQSHISAMDSVPATLSIAQKVRGAQWKQMAVRAPIAK